MSGHRNDDGHWVYTGVSPFSEEEDVAEADTEEESDQD